MCRRLSLFTPQSVLTDRFSARARTPLAPRYNIAPGEALAIIRDSAPDEISLASWGFIPGWMTNLEAWPTPAIARVETVTDNPAYRFAFADTRCLVLVDGFYVWDGPSGESQPYRVERPDGGPFALAGLWQEPTTNGRSGRTVVVLTTEANPVTGRITARMPAILERDDEVTWLDAEATVSELVSLLDPVPAARTTSFPVSKAVNDPSTDHRGVIRPIEIGNRSALGE